MTDEPTPATPEDLTPEQIEAIEKFIAEFAQKLATVADSLNQFAFFMGQAIGGMYATISELQRRNPELFVLVPTIPDDDDESPGEPS